jgi:type III secretory pathway component EscU
MLKKAYVFNLCKVFCIKISVIFLTVLPLRICPHQRVPSIVIIVVVSILIALAQQMILIMIDYSGCYHPHFTEQEMGHREVKKPAQSHTGFSNSSHFFTYTSAT